ncbi:DUF1360 domain-containing protein [Lederbergia lenta]|nr:DUF1360 domain-containing protein [Lederbergia lenta]MCM3110435.1 DUF1360 domain-containing protein [Lederbergia lenta]MEC2323999.1 DUF1360 domain-containing protein [Lederbergia lenta]
MKIEWIDFIIFGLAVFRLTRLVVYDRITSFVRAPFMKEYKETSEQGEQEIYLIPREHGLRGFIGELLSCYWCTGIWAAMGIWFLYDFMPKVAEPVIIILAIAGIAAIVETIIQSKYID